MIRLLVVLGLLGGLIYLIKSILPALQSIFLKTCQHCEGNGFWRGTRGEKNFCNQCMGTGRLK